jgi:hypothetical protein
MTCLRDIPPTHAEIALAAYYLWQKEVSDTLDKDFFRRERTADENWFIAERRLMEVWHDKCREEEEIQGRGCPEP